jgi:hypothetical protein
VNRPRPNRFRDVPGDERIARASARAHRLVDHIATLFLMHESNTLVIYSPKMSAQIPRPFAAHAFNQCQRSMHLFEIIRLCALWDPPGTDRESIPTIVELFNEPALVEQIARDAQPLRQRTATGRPRREQRSRGCCRTKSLVDERSDYLRGRGGAAGAPAACVCRRQGGRDSGVAPADSAYGFSARLHRPQSDAARTRHEDRGDRRRRLPSAVRIGTRVMPSSRLLSLSLEIA